MSYVIYTILLSLYLILSLLLIVLFSELKISSYCISLSVNSSVYYYSLITKLDCKNLIMCSCKKCISYNLTCCINKNSSKCNKCTYASSQKCDLILSKVK